MLGERSDHTTVRRAVVRLCRLRNDALWTSVSE